MSTIEVSTTGSNDIALRADYKYIEACRAVPDGVFDDRSKRWIYPGTPMHANLILDTFLGQQVISTEAFDELALRNGRHDDIPQGIGAYHAESIPCTATKPYAHQVAGYHRIMRSPATLLAWEMGTGKSKTVVDVVINLSAQRTLIICPKAVVSVWPAEFSKHAGKAVAVIPLNVGSIRQRAALATKYLQTGKPCALVINYEAVWRAEMAKIVEVLRWDLIVCDEIHRIKKPSGKASRFIGRLRRLARKRVGLSGTPMAHSPLDIYAEFRFLDPTIFPRTATGFRARYCIMGGFDQREIVGWRNTRELRDNYRKLAMTVKSANVLDLPEQIDEERHVELGDAALRAYAQLHRHFVAEVKDGVVTASNALSRLLRLQQLTSGFAIVQDQEHPENDPTTEHIDGSKEAELAELLEDLQFFDKVVVFARFRNDLDAIARACKKVDRRCYELSGRRNELEDWQQCSIGAVLATQIQTGREGIDLTKARYCVYYSLGFSLADYEQSRKRLHRPGQKRSVVYVHLVCRNTVDEQVYAALCARKQTVEAIIEGVTDGE